MKIVGLYLAAGNSRRTGRVNKLSLPIHNTLLGNLALAAALTSNLNDIVVIANETSWLTPSLQKEKLHIISCKNASLGQSYSVHCGVVQAEMISADGVMIILADQPLITAELLNEVIECYKQNSELDYVAASYQGIPRPPALFSKKVFSALKSIKGDKGARSIFSNSLFYGRNIPYNNAELFYDVDTLEDYHAVQTLFPSDL
jgi:molybdenum cofactor cytidylyltransferase